MTYGVDALQEDVTQDVKGHTSARLDAAVGHAVAGVGKAQIFFLQGELLAADRDAHDGEFVDGRVGRVDVSLLARIVFAAWDRVVDGFAGRVVDESEGCSGIGDGLVAGTWDRLAGYDCRCAVEHPEPLGFVHGRVVRGLAAKGGLIDVAEGVKGFAFVGVVGVFEGAEFGSEELGGLWDVVLGDHVLNGSLDGLGGDGIDGCKGETEEAVTAVLLKLGGKGFGQLYRLVLDDETAKVDDVCSDRARRRGIISVGNLPGRAGGVLEGA